MVGDGGICLGLGLSASRRYPTVNEFLSTLVKRNIVNECLIERDDARPLFFFQVLITISTGYYSKKNNTMKINTKIVEA